MKHKQYGFAHWLIPIVIILLAAAGFAVMRVANNKTSGGQSSQKSPSVQGGSGPNYKALTNCGSNKAILSTVPTDLSQYYEIIPLGNQGVPDHTTPTDHLYFAFNQHDTQVPLVSPGKIVITSIELTGEQITGKDNRPNDYALTFSACKGVTFSFAHIESLSSALDAVAPKSTDSSCTHDNQAAGTTTFYCNKSIDLPLNAGDSIGMVGGNPILGAFDFGAHSASYTDPGYVDSKWHVDQTAVCGLDYFSEPAKTDLYAKLKRTAEPLCGVIGQDKANTLQGNWYATNDYNQGIEQWNKNLSLVHNNIQANVGELAVGGTITDPSTYGFNPTHIGTINREPSETKADTIYCYQDEITDARVNHGSGKVLMELINNYQMKAEHKDGSCTANETFSSPTSYYR